MQYIILKHHTTNIDIVSIKLIIGSLFIKGMRFQLHVILTVLTLYFLNNCTPAEITVFPIDNFSKTS